MGDGNEKQKHNTPEYREGYERIHGVECPNEKCGNRGWYPVQVSDVDWEQEQCEFCYCHPNSRFRKLNPEEFT